MMPKLQYLRYGLPAIAFFAGFIWDALTIGRGVSSLDLIVLSAYLFATMPIIWWLTRQDNLQAGLAMFPSQRIHQALQATSQKNAQAHQTRQDDPQGVTISPAGFMVMGQYLRARLPYLVLQFLYGSLFSALFILYFKSASHLTALLWTLSLGVLLVGNEFLENAYKRFTLTWTLFSFCTILLFNFAIPYLVGSIHPIWFYLSVAVALVLTQSLKSLIAERAGKIWPTYGLALLLVLAYVFDVIPPVPLVKRDIQVGTQLEKTAGHYVLMQDKPHWWQFWRASADTIYVPGSEAVYCVSAIQAPPGLNTMLYHRWQQYDETHGWQTRSRIGFSLSGGRDAGYRGYTYKKNITEGKWRVNVETQSAQTIVSYAFKIINTQEAMPKVPKLM